ncbi:MAG TPA: hypothetical protein VM093_04225 [Aeromicrobium sp.]|nr:hypothetical protein [Aeromicrobium sp.]
MTMRFERLPGSEETLLALYDAVVAAEELDLAQQADLERRSETTDDEPAADALEPDESFEPADAERVSMPQALGVVEHLLGGHPID